jgi:hypothetical protein
MAITLQQISKDPDAILDYVVDWTSWLTPITDTIASVVWVVPTGVTETAVLFSNTSATIWLSGGTLSKVYTIVCRVTTANGRTEDHSFNILIEQH